MIVSSCIWLFQCSRTRWSTLHRINEIIFVIRNLKFGSQFSASKCVSLGKLSSLSEPFFLGYIYLRKLLWRIKNIAIQMHSLVGPPCNCIYLYERIRKECMMKWYFYFLNGSTQSNKILILHDKLLLFANKSLIKTLFQLCHPDFIMIMALNHFSCNSVLFLLYILR